MTFLDINHWRMLASRYGVNLPKSNLSTAKEKHARRFLSRVGIHPEEYNSKVGEKVAEFFRLNPNWPVYAWAGLVLEWIDEGELERTTR